MGKKQNKVYFIKIRAVQYIRIMYICIIYKYMQNNYLSITIPSKEVFAIKSEP
jgi:hypothetical protein